MATLLDFAKSYEPTITRNISELKEVSTDLQIVDDEFQAEDKKTGDMKTIKQKVIVLNGEKYRVPISVITNLKAILEKNPNLKKFSVTKKGSGLQTQYTVIQL
jgi:hypothetical protein